MSRSTSVIQEGGLGGHMDHLYDNPNLTFGEMKEIFRAAAEGKLTGTQKLDGQNIFITYSLKRGRAFAARNKGNLKAGGMTAEELATKFKGRGALQKAFVDAFKAFEEAVASFSEEEIIGAFGEDGEIYYSAEVIDPGSPNVIDYDEKVLNIHRTGHGRVDRETGGTTSTDKDDDMRQASSVLDAAISRIENKKQSTNFKVQRSAIQNLESATGGEAAERAISALDSIVGGEGQTVGEFVVAKLKPMIRQKVDLPKDKLNQLIQKMLGAKGINKREIKKGLDEATQQGVEEFLAQSKSILKTIIRPIEVVVHDFSVDMLQGLQSLYMLGAQEPKVQKLRDKVAAEIQAIEASGAEGDIGKLKAQLEKMKYAEKGLDGISTAAEGFVFDYNGHTYKFTGNFAPINQILGILRYKKGGKETVSESKIIKEEKGRGVALVPGGFKPPHAGHFELAAWAGSQPGVDRAIVLISPKARDTVDAQMSMKIWNIYKSLGANFDVQISGVASPVGAAYEYVDNQAQPGDTIYVIKGEKDASDKRFQAMQGRKEGVEVKELTSPTFAGGVSGTAMRGFIKSGDVNSFQAALPDGLSQDAKNKAWEVVSGGNVSMKEYLIRVVNEVLEEEQGPDAPKAFATVAIKAMDIPNLEAIVNKIALTKKPMEEERVKKIVELASEALYDSPTLKVVNMKEETAMAGGGVEGAAGGAWSNFDAKENEKEKPGGTVMEHKTFSRTKILEEMMLRENIRKVISEAKTRRRLAKLTRRKKENVLRELIRDLILEAEEAAPHESTGINVLEDLLKKIVPQIEGDYKTLTTDKVQRDSFRAHILNATENTIAPKSAVQVGDAEDAEMDSEEELPALEEIEINVGESDEEEVVDAGDITDLDDDEKLIDIGDIGGGQQDDGAFQGLAGEDDTGRNMANMSFQKIEKSITDSYALLGNDEDQKLFRDYLLTNLKLYFDKFEDELGAGGDEEPTTDEYEEEKGEAADTEEAGAEEPEEGGEEELDLGL